MMELGQWTLLFRRSSATTYQNFRQLRSSSHKRSVKLTYALKCTGRVPFEKVSGAVNLAKSNVIKRAYKTYSGSFLNNPNGPIYFRNNVVKCGRFDCVF